MSLLSPPLIGTGGSSGGVNSNPFLLNGAALTPLPFSTDITAAGADITTARNWIFNGDVTINGTQTVANSTVVDFDVMQISPTSLTNPVGLFIAPDDEGGGGGTYSGNLIEAQKRVATVNTTVFTVDSLGALFLNNQITWDSGVAVTASKYQVGRDADGTNQLHFNTPTGAGMEWSIDDLPVLILDGSGNFRTADAPIVGTSGYAFTLITGNGFSANNIFTGGLGGAINITGGVGGAASATLGGGGGGYFQLFGGDGGAGSAGAVSGSGGSINLFGGVPGGDGGFGVGNYGGVVLGTQSGIEFHVLESTISALLPLNSASAFLISQGLNSYLTVTTVAGVELMQFGSAAINPKYTFLGSGAVRFDGIFDAAGSDLTADQLWGANAGATAMEGKTLIAGANIGISYGVGTITIDAAGGGGGGAPSTAQYVTLALDAGLGDERVLTGTTNQITITDNGANSTVVLSLPQNIHTGASPTFTGLTLSGGVFSATVLDNNASAFVVQEGANIYFKIVTTNTSESITFGNAATTPSYSFLGTGTTTFGGSVQATIKDNTSDTFLVQESTNKYIQLSTTNNSEVLNLGNSSITTSVTTVTGGQVQITSTKDAISGILLSTGNAASTVTSSKISMITGSGGAASALLVAGNGGNIELTLGSGGAANNVNPLAAGTGGAFALVAGIGGNADLGVAAAGGAITLTSGFGGDGTALLASANGGAMTLGSGQPGTSHGGGVGVSGALTLKVGANNALAASDSAYTFGNTTKNPTYTFTGSGITRFDGLFKAGATALTANQVWGANNGATAMEGKTITAGTNVTVTHAAGSITINSATAPISAQYVTLALDATLTGERVLTGTANQIVITDNGANSTVVMSISPTLYKNISTRNFFFGNAGNITTTGTDNVATGHVSQSGVTTGTSNTSYGNWTLQNLTSGTGNTAVGTSSLNVITTATANTALGFQVMSNTTGSFNTGVGYLTFNNLTTGSDSTAIGRYALYSSVVGNYNAAVGSYALYNNTGSGNVAIGFRAGSYETGSNAFYVDNQDRTNTAGDKAKAILYGIMATAAVNQTLNINAVVKPIQTTTAGAPAYVEGGIYYDTTLHKLRVGGAAAWETITSA